jgi:hypothetical protein
MRILLTLITLVAGAYGLWWIGQTHPEIKARFEDFTRTNSLRTLELHYTAAQIMEDHRRELLLTNRHQYLEPKLTFYPYLLFELKYRHSQNETREGIVLWDLVDGEMVIDTRDWSKTHGFGDCLSARTDKEEFKIVNTLANRGGACDRATLSKILRVEDETLDNWIKSCLKKKLIIQAGNRYRLHMDHPKFNLHPVTRLHEHLVTQTATHREKAGRRFSSTEIHGLIEAAFGRDVTILSKTDLYLPVHGIVVKNPDGSVHTSYWNARNGTRMKQPYFVE